jgi:hypothetical protein
MIIDRFLIPLKRFGTSSFTLSSFFWSITWHYVWFNFVSLCCADVYLLPIFVIAGAYLAQQLSMTWPFQFGCHRFCWDWTIVDLLKPSVFRWKIKTEVQGWLSAFHLRSESILSVTSEAVLFLTEFWVKSFDFLLDWIVPVEGIGKSH